MNSGRITVVGPEDLADLLGQRKFTVIHLDAEWDGYRIPVAQRMEALMDSHPDVSFAYMDIDRYQEHARAIGLRNVPACSYYRGETLVSTVIGLQQDISSNIAIVRSGGTPPATNKVSRA